MLPSLLQWGQPTYQSLWKNKKEAKTGQARDAVKATGIQRREVLRPITRLVCTCVLRPRLRRPCGAKSKERGRTIADVRRKQGGKGQQETPTLSAKKHTSHQGNCCSGGLRSVENFNLFLQNVMVFLHHLLLLNHQLDDQDFDDLKKMLLLLETSSISSQHRTLYNHALSINEKEHDSA